MTVVDFALRVGFADSNDIYNLGLYLHNDKKFNF